MSVVRNQKRRRKRGCQNLGHDQEVDLDLEKKGERRGKVDPNLSLGQGHALMKEERKVIQGLEGRGVVPGVHESVAGPEVRRGEADPEVQGEEDQGQDPETEDEGDLQGEGLVLVLVLPRGDLVHDPQEKRGEAGLTPDPAVDLEVKGPAATVLDLILPWTLKRDWQEG